MLCEDNSGRDPRRRATGARATRQAAEVCPSQGSASLLIGTGSRPPRERRRGALAHGAAGLTEWQDINLVKRSSDLGARVSRWRMLATLAKYHGIRDGARVRSSRHDDRPSRTTSKMPSTHPPSIDQMATVNDS